MNDRDTEFKAPEEIKLTDNPDNMSALTLEANVHVVDQGTTYSKELETKKEKKSQKKIPWSHDNTTFPHILQRIAVLRAEMPVYLTQVLQLLIFMNKLLILMFWLRYLFNKAISIRKKIGENVSLMLRKWKLSLVSNYIMSINQLPTTAMYWDCDHFLRNIGIQNILARARYLEVLQKNHFADNTKQDKTDKVYKSRPIMDHLNESLQAVFSNNLEQSIDENMTKFKRCSTFLS